MLLHDDLRLSMGIILSNSVVVFDEAHNVVEAVNHIYSADVSYDQLLLATQCMDDYLVRFRSVLTGKNYYYINILLSVINGFQQCLKPDRRREVAGATCHRTDAATAQTAQTVAATEILGVNDFLFRCGLDNVNLFKVKRHVTETNLDSKVGGFADHQERKRAVVAKELRAAAVARNLKGKHQKVKLDSHNVGEASAACSSSSSVSTSTGLNSSCCSRHSSDVINVEGDEKIVSGGYKNALRSVLKLIACLTNADVDGRLAVYKDSSQSGARTSTSTSTATATSEVTATITSPSIKFILLNPSVHFQKILDQSRSVLLLGGTLQPFAYVKSFLFPRVPPDKVSLFACGHVVSSSNILALIAPTGPVGGRLEFTHDSRMQLGLLTDLNMSLKLISKSVPHGMVVFFSSYRYMGTVISKWKSMGVFDDLAETRAIFIEPHQASDTERVWTSYSEKAIAEGGKGAMLFCVMGGKLSEGINFSDRLARCVVVIGMPFPDGRDPVLQEKLKFATLVEKDTKAGVRLYEAMCMRTVNQCIGRSIRHINDYAAIVLLDCRYDQPRVTSQLPMWLSCGVQSCSAFRDVQVKLKTFFDVRTSH